MKNKKNVTIALPIDMMNDLKQFGDPDEIVSKAVRNHLKKYSDEL